MIASLDPANDVEVSDYQIPAEAIFAPDTIDPTVIGGFSTNYLLERDQLHAAFRQIIKTLCVHVGLEAECADDIMGALPVNHVVNAICAGRHRRIHYGIPKYYGNHGGFGTGPKLDTITSVDGSHRASLYEKWLVNNGARSDR